MKRLIVNADDFGLSENVNLGIVSAHKEGIVTSTSLLSGCPAAGHAAELAKENPALGVGVHLCLTRETPVTNPSRLPTLTRSGRLHPGPFAFVTRFAFGLIKKEEVEAELRALGVALRVLDLLLQGRLQRGLSHFCRLQPLEGGTAGKRSRVNRRHASYSSHKAVSNRHFSGNHGADKSILMGCRADIGAMIVRTPGRLGDRPRRGHGPEDHPS